MQVTRARGDSVLEWIRGSKDPVTTSRGQEAEAGPRQRPPHWSDPHLVTELSQIIRIDSKD